MKELKDISWNVTEEEYRADPALSYSTLAKYERSGFNCIDNLFDKIETSSLTFGSAVDSIITGGMDEFNSRFINISFPAVSNSIITIVKELFNGLSNEYNRLEDVPDSFIINACVNNEYHNNWKPATRVKNIKEEGSKYYELLYLADTKTILDDDTYNSVLRAVDALRNFHEDGFYYFQMDNPFDNIKRYYQLKFKGVFDGVEYRNMADLIVVNYDNKTVLPIDLKTSSHTEYEFYKSFIDWRYDIQSRLYWQIIRQNMDKDSYFKDFKLLDYKFIVVNKKTLNPLVWDCPFTQSLEELNVGRFNQYKLRHPFVIGKELSAYLSSRPIVPNGININKSNNLNDWLCKL